MFYRHSKHSQVEFCAYSTWETRILVQWFSERRENVRVLLQYQIKNRNSNSITQSIELLTSVSIRRYFLPFGSNRVSCFDHFRALHGLRKRKD